MAVDVAELLVSLALAVGNERSIAPAVRHIDPEVLRRCPPLLQRAALSAATRHAIGSRHGLLEDLRARLSREIGIEEPPRKAPLLRVRPRSIVLLVLAALALHVLLPQIGEIPRTLTALRSIHLDWVAILLLASVLTYLGAAVSLVAACPVGLPFLRTLAVVTAASFANRLAPSGLGRAGLDIRYVERHGASRSVAVATEAINAIGGGIVHGVALVLAGVLFGGSAFGAVNLKGEVIVAIAVVGVLVAAGVVIVVGPWRGTVVATLTEAWGAFRTVTRQPAKAVRLLAGAVVLNAGYVIALQASLEAVGASVSAGTVALVYLGGAAIAAASPTPGGLGAAEAAYVAALAAAGVEASLAVAGVLVFRLVTFWLPTLPGWFAFRWLRHREYA
jgi:undecaprenyl-diphosphatase